MPAFYKIDKANRLVMSTASGTITGPEARAHHQSLSADPDFDPSYSQLLDCSHVTKIEVSSDDIRTLAQDNLFSATSRRAFLVSNDAAFGLARMFEIIRETQGDSGIQVFRNLDEALDWVLARRASA
ncbi:MAG TPA: hypothetical protein VII25_04210 [Candidatus Acidoferrum sp.]